MLDLTNQVYGRLTVIKEVERVKNARRWLCRCECENEIIAYQSNLRKGHTKSCGCLVDDFSKYVKEEFAINLKGMQFGFLTALSRVDKKRVSWLCQCACGNKTTVSATNLQSGHTTSCGCKRVEAINQIREETDERMRVDDVLVHTLSRKVSSTNKTGVKGVSIVQKSGVVKYRVNISVKGKRIALGTYNNLDDAIKARKAGEEKYHKPYIDKFNNEG